MHKKERYWENVRDCNPTTRKSRGIYKSTCKGLHKALKKGGMPSFVKSSRSPQIKKCAESPEHHQKGTFNRTQTQTHNHNPDLSFLTKNFNFYVF